MSVTVVTVYLLFLCAQSGNANSGQRDTFPDTLHAHKALSHLLPINDTEEIGCILLPTVYNVQNSQVFLGMVMHAQAVDTRALSPLPHSLVTRPSA